MNSEYILINTKTKIESIITKSVTISHKFKANYIEADNIYIENYNVNISTIKCKFLKIKINKFNLFNKQIVLKSIQAQTIHLENCVVEKIIADDIILGNNCKVNTIFYNKSLSIHPNSIVYNIKRIAS